jgi:predicted RNA-binding protein with PIN domain
MGWTGSVECVAFEKHLLVDGANLLHAWPELRALMKRDRGAARSQLIQKLGVIHDADQTRVTVVFDGRGDELVIERPAGHVTFSVLYTPSSLTGDDVIEQLVGRASDASSCHVATGDQTERQTIEAGGAVWVPPTDLAAWVERAESRLAATVKGLNRNNAKKWKSQS